MSVVMLVLTPDLAVAVRMDKPAQAVLESLLLDIKREKINGNLKKHNN